MKKKAEIKSLNNRVEVLEFKEAAKGERFIHGDIIVGFPFSGHEIKWISEDEKRVVTDIVNVASWQEIKFNGNYVEVWDKGVVDEAYRVKNDILVDMDVNVYRKAFYPKTEKTKETPKVTHWRQGDRVRCIKAYEENDDAVGKEGRIVTITDKLGRVLIGVGFDEPFKGGHRLDGFVADGRGWWFSDPAEYLVKL